eukprot:2093301-Amphidinium_carterae.1
MLPPRQVLRAKFRPGRRFTKGLLATGDTFLLEHNSAHAACIVGVIWLPHHPALANNRFPSPEYVRCSATFCHSCGQALPPTCRDDLWSDNHVGDGRNWLGLQLMILRDELRGGARSQ